MEVRRADSGEVVFRDHLTCPVAAILRADYRNDGQEQVVVCGVEGEVREGCAVRGCGVGCYGMGSGVGAGTSTAAAVQAARGAASNTGAGAAARRIAAIPSSARHAPLNPTLPPCPLPATALPCPPPFSPAAMDVARGRWLVVLHGMAWRGAAAAAGISAGGAGRGCAGRHRAGGLHRAAGGNSGAGTAQAGGSAWAMGCSEHGEWAEMDGCGCASAPARCAHALVCVSPCERGRVGTARLAIGACAAAPLCAWARMCTRASSGCWACVRALRAAGGRGPIGTMR